MKIGFYFSDRGIKNLNLQYPELGNPGVGGTEYCFLMLIRYLGILHPEVELICYHFNENILPSNCKENIISNEEECIKGAKQDEVDILLHVTNQSMFWYDLIDKYQINTILWAHCFLNKDELKRVAYSKFVRRVVFVGKEQYDTYLDHDVIKKSTYIYNMFNAKRVCYKRIDNFGLNVTYVGSITVEKGFDILASVWRDVLKKVPNAQLFVIGTGNLYRRDCKLGKYGIATQEFEEKFIKYLVDEKGEIIPSVHFLGLLGQEKVEIFQDTAVGIINPSAVSETFGLSGVEMEACGIPIATKGRLGLLDTVVDRKTGLLSRTKRQFANNIIYLLKNYEKNKLYGNQAQEFVRQQFDPNKITEEWHKLFFEIKDREECMYIPPSKFIFNDMKVFRIIIRKLRFNLGLRKVLPLIEFKFLIKKILFGK